MLKKTRIAALAVVVGLSCAPLWAAGDAPSQKQRFAAAMAQRASAPERMVAQLQALSDEGYARATDRLAYMTYKGIGTAQDIARSKVLFRAAVDAGRTSSLVSLGKILMSDGDHQDAITALEAAVREGHAKAAPVLAWAHATGRLGDLSNKARGFSDLEKLADEDVLAAQMYLLDAAARNNRRPGNLSSVLDRLHARHGDGNARAAEALLRYYRAQRHPRGSIRTRVALMQTEGLRDKIRIEEGLYLALAQRPEAFWTLSEDLVKDAPRDVFARALSVTARINKNAYVRIVQKELRAQGYDVGEPSPYLKAPLIRAIAKFCTDTGMDAACQFGPLKSTTVKALAAKLAETRTPT
ncbi:sel1 repeat family protein [Pseudaestuariivita atlantica]|uniref:Uncharacterized protein n=1 Tax=Pseudaestuariivita atlantica TaxID=1317121 RepID=A0A0L1JMW7_9RHOB|nr:sel1 repeat family protein [Pseudaestuariivita atlantica]KNG93094.1 hypothetical protein ATO11_14385 [Pseudaestuariivita atlantica]